MTVIGYLLGFLALACFAFLASGRGPASDDTLLMAFKASSPLALAETAFLLWRPAPVNRLILGANLWLCAGGLAAVLEQWWWLLGYQRLGEASLFLSMLVVGLVSTALSPAGFVAALGERRRVVQASLGLLAAVGLALCVAVWFRGDVRYAAVFPVIALSWLNRLLRRAVARPDTLRSP